MKTDVPDHSKWKFFLERLLQEPRTHSAEKEMRTADCVRGSFPEKRENLVQVAEAFSKLLRPIERRVQAMADVEGIEPSVTRF